MEKNTKNTEMKPVRVPVLALRGLVLFQMCIRDRRIL